MRLFFSLKALRFLPSTFSHSFSVLLFLHSGCICFSLGFAAFFFFVVVVVVVRPRQGSPHFLFSTIISVHLVIQHLRHKCQKKLFFSVLLLSVLPIVELVCIAFISAAEAVYIFSPGAGGPSSARHGKRKGVGSVTVTATVISVSAE